MTFVAVWVRGVEPALPVKTTEFVPASPLPLIVTVAPNAAEVGEIDDSLGSTVNGALLPVPAALVTVIGPVTPVEGTATVSVPALFVLIVPVAVGLPNVTLLTAPRVFPVIVTVEPARPWPGCTSATVGRIPKPVEVVPPGVVTETVVAVARSGTVAVRCESSTGVNGSPTPPNLTDKAPVSDVPLTVSVSPTRPLVSDSDVIPGMRPKLAAVETGPSGPATVIGPLVAPAGTVAVSLPAVTCAKDAATPLNCTPVARSMSVPRMVTVVPTEPFAGEKLEMTRFGGRWTHSCVALLHSRCRKYLPEPITSLYWVFGPPVEPSGLPKVHAHLSAISAWLAPNQPVFVSGSVIASMCS